MLVHAPRASAEVDPQAGATSPPTMNEPTEGGRSEIERIMRRAEAIGEDPQRVAWALGHIDREATELQAVQEVKRQSWLRRLRAKGSPANSRSS